MHEFAIDVRNVSAHYSTRKQRVAALTDVSLKVTRGEIFGLLGPNGAGKTTLLACIQALHKPDAGSVMVGGLDVAQHSARTKRMLGIQLQRTALLDGLKASELIEAYASLYDTFLTPDQIAMLLKHFDLSDQAGKLARQMSGGQQQRLSLAIAIANNPEIVLLDEPTEALDPGARRGVWAMIRQLKEQGRTVVLTTHSMDEAESLCGRVAIMDRGRVMACDTPQQLIAELGINAMLKATIELPLEQVQPLVGAMAASYTGEQLEIETTQPIITLNALHELADKHGRVVRDIAIRQPNLEDVYLKLTGYSLSQAELRVKSHDS